MVLNVILPMEQLKFKENKMNENQWNQMNQVSNRNRILFHLLMNLKNLVMIVVPSERKWENRSKIDSKPK
jgi:hypothetical protein